MGKLPQVHPHPWKDELCVFHVPADTDKPMEAKVVKNDWRSLGQLVGGYLEIVRTQYMPELSCGCQMVMVVNEEGLLQDLEQNPRVGIYYPYGMVVGDVFLAAEGPCKDKDGDDDIDLIGLSPTICKWEGPGSPMPSPKQPWEDS
jgi:hypothetical protein